MFGNINRENDSLRLQLHYSLSTPTVICCAATRSLLNFILYQQIKIKLYLNRALVDVGVVFALKPK